ncbi:MAG TPA: sigma-70 family RNA polymerase sigma factor [Deltaproteobacteria bacterium]|nr:sigma-70 family RNA polymerase sigma factor [Deltaproteobacteria bacterium]
MPSIQTDVLAARRGDAEAFARLVDHHTSVVCAITTAILGSVDAGEEVGQEVFVCAWEGLPRLRSPRRFPSWLRQIARNRAHETLRRRLQRREVPGDVLTGLADPRLDTDERLDSERREAVMWEALEVLDEPYREVLILYYREGCSVRQVAEHLELTEPTVRKRLSRAREHLRDGVEERLGVQLRHSAPRKAAFVAAVSALTAALPLRPAQAARSGLSSWQPLRPSVALRAATLAASVLVLGGWATIAVLRSQLPPIEPPRAHGTQLAAYDVTDPAAPLPRDDASRPPRSSSDARALPGTPDALPGTPDALPDHVVHAFLAAEDARFFEHGGVDVSAVARATLSNLLGGGALQGGSTLTQQLAKRMLIEQHPDPTLSRKLSELVLALELEHRLTKDEILERYLDGVYLGAGARGLEEAAERYLGKPPGALTLAEAALLATIPAHPVAHSPLLDPQGAKRRRDQVLDRMAALGWASSGAVAAAQRTPARLPGDPTR